MGCQDGTEDGKGISKELKVEDWKVGRRGIQRLVPVTRTDFIFNICEKKLVNTAMPMVNFIESCEEVSEFSE